MLNDQIFEVCDPCLVLQDEIHAHLKPDLLAVLGLIEENKPSDLHGDLATIFLLQAIQCKPTQKTYRLQKDRE